MSRYAGWKSHRPIKGRIMTRKRMLPGRWLLAAVSLALTFPFFRACRGLSAPVTTGSSPASLDATLPSLFEATKPFSASTDGVVLPQHAYIRTKAGDFLGRDFTLDLWLTIDPKLPRAFVGVGSGGEGMSQTPTNSIYLDIEPNGKISLSTCEGYGNEGIGDELDPGEYIVRVQKSGSSVTLAVGVETNGVFEPDVTRTFADISKTPANFDSRNMHVFFGGGQYRQYRFNTTGAIPSAQPPAPAPQREPPAAAALHGSLVDLPAVQFTANLPPDLECDGTFSVFKDRIVIPELTYLRTKDGGFLHKDFVMELWLTVDPKKPKAFIGVGSGRNGEHAQPVNSIYMVVKADGRIEMATREGHGDEHIGKELDPGEFVVRLEKRGLAVTYSIGTEQNGSFEPDVTKTFIDITKTPADFNDRNMHIFFGGGQYRQIRFVSAPEMVPAPAPPQNTAPVAVPAGAGARLVAGGGGVGHRWDFL
jgi:hypothetical protein